MGYNTTMSTMNNEYNKTMGTMSNEHNDIQYNNEYNVQWQLWVQYDNEYNDQWDKWATQCEKWKQRVQYSKLQLIVIQCQKWAKWVQCCTHYTTLCSLYTWSESQMLYFVPKDIPSVWITAIPQKTAKTIPILDFCIA